MNHYFRGQALVAFIVGILFCIGFSIIGLPMAIVLGLFIGLLNMVPISATHGISRSCNTAMPCHVGRRHARQISGASGSRQWLSM